MSEARSIGAPAPSPRVRLAIANAAQATGIDFGYLLGEARLESSLDPSARARTSSAAGLYQFTRATWLNTLEAHGARHGLGWAGQAIERGRIDDPAARSRILDLRYDPQASALMAAELARENRDRLLGKLGREPEPAELYLAHFLGLDGAIKFLGALDSNPDQSASDLFPQAAAANRAVFFDQDGAARSLEQVMGLMRSRLTGAMAEDGGVAALQPGLDVWSGLAAGGQVDPAGHQPERPSMAYTLASVFGGSGPAMPSQVREAYGKLRSLGL